MLPSLRLEGRMQRAVFRWLIALLCFSLLCAAPAAALDYGVNYAHWDIGAGCNLDNRGIVATYHEPGVRQRVTDQLRIQKAEGFDTIRFILWHVDGDVSTHTWGIVGSPLSGTVKSNLVQFAADVQAAGYRELEISFGPQGANSPLISAFDPSRIESNWRTITDSIGVLDSFPFVKY